MKTVKRILLILLILLLLIIIIGAFYLRNMSHKALPDYNENVQLQGLHAPVEVFRDAYAIPHVYAQDEHDLYVAVGYLLAQDRLWQMDLLRRVTQGRLSEIFGESYVDTDMLLRALRFQDKSEKILFRLDTALMEALESFSSGVNQYIQQHQKDLPLEFSLLGYKPDLWEPLHSLNMIGYMAWDLKAGWSEIVLTDIQNKVDSIMYQEILPDMSGEQSTVFPDYYTKSGQTALIPELLLHSAGLEKLGVDIFDGSNNWAVLGFKSTTGKPLLANDMHLSLNIPGIWYQMHQKVEGKVHVSGLVLPGTPLVICGHNDSIAWGMTNTYVDNLDFYEEHVNPDNPTQYEYMGEWRDMEVRTERIKISDGSQVEKEQLFTHRGAIVTDYRNVPGRVISMHWVGDEMSNEMLTVYKLNRANNWKDFKNALITFTSISQNIVYADKKGNVGLYCAAGIPLRKRDAVFAILPGWTDEYDWQGFVPFEELPHTVNPATGFVVSANNRTTTPDYPYHIGTWYSLPNRYDRISEMLTDKEVLSVEDFKTIQLDQHSRLAEKYVPVIITSCESVGSLNDIEEEALQLLKEWNYDMSAAMAAPIIFETAYHHIMKCVFADELGSSVYNNFSGVNNISRNAMYRLMETAYSSWFDDVGTSDVSENKSEIVARGFKNAVTDLQEQLKGNPASWEWGDLHTFTLIHPLSEVKILDKAFHLNRGPFQVGGSFHTVSPYSYIYAGRFDVDHGSSQRHIYDLSDWDLSLTVIPTGNSGISASDHYCDQTDLYINGNYHNENFSRAKVEENAVYYMEFISE